MIFMDLTRVFNSRIIIRSEAANNFSPEKYAREKDPATIARVQEAL